jgi:homoserine O-succinyltransferase/O-acetyltransferase
MPIRIQNDLPVREELEKENLFIVDENRAAHQDIRPLEICILNLMPKKEDTELDILRMLSNTPLQLNITFMRVGSHLSKNTSYSHLHQFYASFDELKDRRFDGLIITGAPVEKLEYEEVDYWQELCDIFAWSVTSVTSTLHICWAAQAGLYYHYGLQKRLLPKKLSGIYAHKVIHRKDPLMRGLDDIFLIPHSRNTEVAAGDIHACSELKVLAESEEAGVLLCTAKEGRQVFIFGHGEYDRYTLRDEYERDLNKGINPEIPENYFPEDDPTQKPLLQWRSASQAMYSNWINYYVYQATPYNLEDIR